MCMSITREALKRLLSVFVVVQEMFVKNVSLGIVHLRYVRYWTFVIPCCPFNPANSQLAKVTRSMGQLLKITFDEKEIVKYFE